MIRIWFYISAIVIITIAIANADTPCTGDSVFVPYNIYGSPKTIQPIPLPRGKWDCVVGLEAKADKAQIQALMVSLSQIANKLDDGSRTATSGPNGGPGYGLSVSTMPVRIENPEQKTFFVNAQVYFSGGTIQLRSHYICTNVTISN